MNTRFAKWGNSLALRIPATFAQELSIGDGASAEVFVVDGCLVVRPVTGPHYDLETLVRGITEANLHGETGTGAAVGNEFR